MSEQGCARGPKKRGRREGALMRNIPRSNAAIQLSWRHGIATAEPVDLQRRMHGTMTPAASSAFNKHFPNHQACFAMCICTAWQRIVARSLRHHSHQAWAAEVRTIGLKPALGAPIKSGW